VDAGLCHDHLSRLLTDESTALTQLAGLLDREHESLASGDIDAIEAAGAARQNCVGELLRIEDERRSLCRLMNYSADVVGIDQMMSWCDPSHELRKRWSTTLELATQCRSRNQRNGTLVAAKLKRVEGLLSVVTGRQTTTVYSAKGAQGYRGGNSLGQA
jgi:flagellar biosynthesis/type III secretory pathway chaperone